ncbi:hypothetical protein OKW76_04435 [Sphingomonas sp. S1-29]|uniref:hypothetical protein n=1 Tax=Sphingomonas sp. S1-29 TaxID=2991074 RepID=UPI00223F7E8D|nr:hypothetical protein [Sphingomonas sp. S1-29]UZK70298.1 hypothetical protein OKW76_04435 [Sphingomonas sp. S1-29]
MTAEFTFEATAQLIAEIGTGLLSAGEFADDGWSGISLVLKIEGALVTHGFKYYPDGSVLPASLVPVETLLKFVSLADQMEGLNAKRWKACLVQIAKPDMKIRLQYEYDDPARWNVTPANIETMRESLRPA